DGMTLLVVDADARQRREIERMLRRLRMKPAAVETGSDALRICAERAVPIHAALVASRPPDMPAAALAGAMRSAKHAPRRLILLSADPVDAAVADGFDAVLSPPLSNADLVQALSRLAVPMP